MYNWCIEHPWIEAIQAIIKYLTGWHKTDKEVELEMLKEKEEDNQ